MSDRIELPIGNNKLVVYVNDWQDQLPKEIFVCIEDENGVLTQDICMVREHYHFDPNKGSFKRDNTLVDCRVWSDSDNEDYTHEFTVSIDNKEE